MARNLKTSKEEIHIGLLIYACHSTVIHQPQEGQHLTRNCQKRDRDQDVRFKDGDKHEEQESA